MILSGTFGACGRLRPRVMHLTLAVSLGVLQPETAFAWVYPEHREITRLAIERLEPTQLASLQQLWSEARVGHQARLCPQLADSDRDPNPTCIDFAAWPAIAGDHSCSADDMLKNVLDTPWILGVARVGARLKTKLSAAKRPDQLANAVRDSDLALVRKDPDYVTRATSNNAHFLLARPNAAKEPAAYARLALGAEAEINAVATYTWYHLRALAKAENIAHNSQAPGAHAQLALAVLADEAFALHFLEDSFTSGHTVGNWGNSAVRLGTHDYYNEHGVAVVTWSGRRFVAFGDAHMSHDDAEGVATAVRDSLAQLIGAFQGKLDVSVSEDSKNEEPDVFDVCRQSHFPALADQVEDLRLLSPIIEQTPVPAIGPGKGELPRFASELGPFVGLTTAVRFTGLGSGFGSSQTGASVTGAVEVAVRVGAGLEGVLNQSSDGLVFAEIGLREDAAANGAEAVPSRGALTARLRAPFWLIPGDVVVAAPVLAFTSRRTLEKMAVRAANGGLIPWQAGIATRIGRFQFVLGREVGLSFYGSRTIATPSLGVGPINHTLVSLRSIQVEFPILEYRLFRIFSMDQSSGLLIQPHVGFDKPTSSSVVSPVGAPLPSLRTIVTGGVRVVFDWRHY